MLTVHIMSEEIHIYDNSNVIDSMGAFCFSIDIKSL